MSSKERGRFAKVATVLVLGLFGALSLILSAAPQTAHAATSSNLNFQARLLNNSGGVVPDGSYNIEFKIYNADSTTGSQGSCSGACLWMETRTGGNVVTVINGYFSVNLGSVTSFPAINWDQQLWLTMRIGGTGTPSWDGEMQNSGHSIALTALPYSFVAGQLAKTSGAHRGTLGFNTVANDPNILLPDASGTVCLQTSSTCGFESTTGNDFIQNQSSTPQSANFDIAGSGFIDTALQVPLIQTADSSTSNSLALALRSGNQTGSSLSSGNVTIKTGDAGSGSNSSSGNVSIDVGTKSGSGTTGTISIGTTNSSGVSIGNAAAAITITGSSASNIVMNGVTISAAELNLLDGHGDLGSTLVDTNDAVSTAITGTGALNSGSITNGFGSIDTGADNISTTGTVSGNVLDRTSSGTLNVGTGQATAITLGGSSTVTTAAGGLTITAGKNFSVNGDIFTDLTGTGLVDLSNALAIDQTASLNWTGVETISNNNAAGFQVSDSSSSKQVITVDTSGDALVLGKAGASGLTGKITFNNAANANAVSIIAGTTTAGYTLTLPTALPGTTQCLQGDNTGTLSFVTCLTGTYVNTVGTYSSSNHYSDGASITGTTLTLGSADATHPGLVDTSSQTFAGNKTFTGAVLAANTADSTAAFQVQNASASSFVTVNTTDGYVIDNGVGNLGNVIENPSFESTGTTDGVGWYTPSASQVIATSAANAHSGNHELQISGNSTTHAVTTKYYAVHPGDQIYIEAYVKNSAGADGDGGIYVEYTDKDKANAVFTNVDTGLPGTSYVLKTITDTVPANKTFVRIAASVKATSTTGTFYFDDFYLKRINEQAPLLLTNASTTAFQVQNASAQTVLGVNTTNSQLFTTLPDGAGAIGFTLNTPSYTTSGAKLISIQNNSSEKFSIDKDGNLNTSGNIGGGGDITVSGNSNIGSGKKYEVNGTQISSADLSNDSNLAKLNGTGPQTFSGNNKFTGTVLSQTTSATAFQVQNATNSVFLVDASGNKTVLGTGGGSGLTGVAQFNYSGSSGSISLVPLDPTSTAYTLNLPAENGILCTSAASSTSNCTNFASASSLSSALAGKLNKGLADTSGHAVTALEGNLYAFTNNSSNIASGVLKLDNNNNTEAALLVTGTTDYATGKAYIVVNNTNGTPSGNLIDLQANSADKFTVDASGNIGAAGNISIATGKVYEINGVQITSAALSNDSNLAKLSASQTFAGDNIFSSASNSFTGNGANLSSLNAGNISTGTLGDGRLSTNVAFRNQDNTFASTNTFSPTANNVGTTINQTSGTATSGSVFDVQAVGGAHFFQITNAASGEGSVTLQSVGATRDLTINSASGTLKLGSATTILQKSASAFTFDLANAGTSTLTVSNSNGSNVASLSVTGDIGIASGRVYKIGGTSGNNISTCGAGQYLAGQTVAGGIVTGGTCTALAGAGDNISVNSSAATDANFLDVASAAAVAGTSWSLDTVPTPDNITLAVANATSTTAGAVTANAQSFGGDKTFLGNTLVKVNGTAAFQVQDASTSTTMFGFDTTDDRIFTNNADGASAIGFTFNTPNYLTTGAKLLSVKNNASEKFSIDLTGTVNIASGATYKINGADINTASTLSNVGYLSANQTFAGTNTFSNATININSSTIATNQSTIALFNTSAANVTAFGVGTNIAIGATTGTTTIKNANTTLGNAAGSGVLTNNGATLNSTLAVADDSDGGALGGTPSSPLTAAQSVDVYTSISVAQTTAGQTITLPTPTASTTYGRMLYLSNIGSASFKVGTATINPGATATLIWSHTTGGDSWQFAGADAGNLQGSYTNSTGGSTSEIVLDSTRGAVDIQDRSTSNGGTLGANLLNVRATAANDSTAGVLMFGIGNTGATTFENSANSIAALQVQNSSAGALFTADTTNMRLGVDVTYALMGTSFGTVTVTDGGAGALTSGSQYFYKITAIDSAGGETTASSEGTLGTGHTALNVAWTAIPHASAYKVYRSTSTNTEVYLTTVLASPFKDTGAITAGSATPPGTNTAYIPTNTSNSELQLSVGGIGTPTGQLYVGGTLPVDISAGGTATASGPGSFYVSGRYAYVTSMTANKLQVFDVSNPASPVDVSGGGVTLGSGPSYISVQGHYAYVADYGANKLQVFDVSNPASPTDISGGGVTTGSGPQAIYVSGRYVYVADNTGAKLQVFDVSNPANPTDITSGGVTTGTGSGPSSVYVSGRYAYVADNTTSKLQVFDVSNPASPVDVTNGGVSTGTQPFSIFGQGRYVYLTAYNSNKLQVFDVSNPTNPTDVSGGGATTGTNPRFVYVSGRYAYVTAYGTSKLQAFDLGGGYVQQLEAGGTETGTLQVDSNGQVAGNFNIQGGLNIGQSIQATGNLGLSGGAFVQGSTILGGGTNLLGAPAGAITVTPTLGTATTWSYVVTTINSAGGESTASATGTTAAGAATLDATHFNTISWSAVTGASAYKVYRTAHGTSPATNGYIGTTASTSLVDNGLAGNATNAPIFDTTGQLTVQGSALFANKTNSTTAFQVQNAAGNNFIQVDTSTPKLSLGDTSIVSTVQIGNTTGAVAQTITIGNGTASSTNNINIGTIGSTTATTNLHIADSTGGIQTVFLGSTSSTSATTINAGVNSTTEMLQLQVAAAGFIGIGTANTTKTIDIGSVGNTVAASTIKIANTTDATNAQAVTIGSTAANAGNITTIQGGTGNGVSLQVASTGTILIGSGTASTIDVGTGAFAHTIAIGNDNTTTQGITIGSTSASSVTTIDGGTGTGVSIQVGTNGTIAIGSGSASTVNVGTGAFAHTIGVGTDSSTAQGITVGSTNSGSAVSLKAGAISELLSNTGDLIQTSSNNTTTFQIQNAIGAQLINVDTTTTNLITNPSIEQGGSPPTGWAVKNTATTPAQSLNQAYIGNDSLLVATTGTANGGALQSVATIAANTTYTLSMYVKASTVAFSTINMGYQNVAGTSTNDFDCLTAQSITVTDWTQLSCTFTTAGTVTTPNIYIKDTSTTAHSFYVDAVQLTPFSLLPNASVEQALGSSWAVETTAVPTITQDATVFKYPTSGGHSLKVVEITGGAAQGVKDPKTLANSTTYYMSFWAYAATSTFATLSAGYSSTGATGGDVDCQTAIPFTTFNTWYQYQCSFTTPASNSGSPYIYFKDTATVLSRTWYIDDVQLSQGPPVAQYIQGTPAAGSFISSPDIAYQEGKVAINGIITSPVTLQNQSDSSTAFQVLNAQGTNVLNVNNVTNTVEITGSGATSGLRFTNLNSSSSGATSFTGILGLDTQGNVGLSQATVSLISPALAYWDGLNAPTGSQVYPAVSSISGAGTGTSSAACGTGSWAPTFVAGQGEELTAACGSQSGSINWNFSQVSFEETQFQFKAGGGNGADSTWFYSYANVNGGVPTSEFGCTSAVTSPCTTTLPSGYLIYFSEWHHCVGIVWGNYADGNQCDNGGGTSGSGLKPLVSSRLWNIGDNNFHDVDIQLRYNIITVSWDGQVVLTYTDTFGRDLSNLGFGFGSRTGGSNNEHYIKGLLVTKLGSDPSKYGVDAISPLANNLYMDTTAGAQKLGIGSIAPDSTLEVDGTESHKTVATSGAGFAAGNYVTEGSGTGITTSPACSNAANGNGTTNFTAGSTVTGTGTTFTSQMVGDQIVLPDGTIDTIATFSSSTSITTTNTHIECPGAYTVLTKALTITGTASPTVGIGNSTADTTQVLLQLDSFSTLADTATCGTTTNQGAMYYNTNSNEVRSCINGAWQDLASTEDLALQLFGVVPNSGPTPGDLVGANGNANSPCKVYWVDATHFGVAACNAYSGGRKVAVAAIATQAVANITTTNLWENICLNSSGVPTQMSGSTTTDGPQTLGNLTTTNATTLGQPLLCLATLKGNGTANTLAFIYDVRTFTTTTKTYATITSATQILGGIVQQSTTAGIVSAVSSATATNILGVIVAGTGASSANAPNIIIATAGPQWVKAVSGTTIATSATDNTHTLIPSTTAGYVNSGTTLATDNSNIGVPQRANATSCSTNTTLALTDCQGSEFTTLYIH